MVDVKVCSKCGVSIPGQAIIDGQAKLLNGQLMCAECAGKAESAIAVQAAQAPAAAGQPTGSAAGGGDETPVKLDEAEEPGGEEITIFGGGVTHGRKEVAFKREPAMTGQGAIRVRTYDSKLSRPAFQVMDEQINQWLDESGYEVKQVTACIGDIHGKTTIEPHLIINIWY